jgi:type II secretion system protein N
MDLLSGLGGRQFLLYAAYTIVLFLVFMVVNFPHHVVVERAVRSLDLGALRLNVADTRFAWFRGYELQGVRLEQVTANGRDAPILDTAGLYVWPGLGNLIRGDLSSIRISGPLYRGDVDAWWSNTDGFVRISLNLRSVELGVYRPLVALFDEGQITGRLSASISMEGRGNPFRTGRGSGELTLQTGALEGAKISGFTLPDLHSCSGSAALRLREGRLEISELQATCDEIELAGGGQLVLREELPNSVLNVKLSPQPGSAPSKEVSALMPLIPRVISGTLARPRSQVTESKSSERRRS